MAAICQWLGISFKDLVLLAEQQTASISVLTEEQEEYFAAFPHFYVYLRCLGANLKPPEIEARYDISRASTERYLTELEILGLIERTAAQGVRLLIPWPANWRFPGPLQRKFGKELFQSTVEHLADKSADTALRGEYGKGFFFMLDSLRLTESTYREYVRDMVALYQKYTTLARFEAKAKIQKELKTYAALLGIDTLDALSKVLGPVVELRTRGKR